jgi:hypothetical protein
MWERVLDLSELSRLQPPAPLLSFLCAQRDGGPQPRVGWRPRSGREIRQAARDQVSDCWTPVGVNPTGVTQLACGVRGARADDARWNVCILGLVTTSTHSAPGEF